eukprot:CAMPEP_0198262440 /NCGR_PEP_ID=MMETSP1447-20131203/10945_1 /TAXON_ID=420782 /ORGANISM="Chaetoceros dichaeta, Strain CCMP1751" /LENGTH=574 /DNA_ID=CAMNT_0043950675 /DNA_START=121 /DNA_END=1845 /DNA_ORIENTATION=+
MKYLISAFAIASTWKCRLVDADSCTGPNSLSCASGYKCKQGEKDFIASGFPAAMVKTLPVFQKNNLGNEYCDCNESSNAPGGGLGMTGVGCTTMFQRCPDKTVCFHGAPCQKGSEDNYFCDCSKTFSSDVTYTGEHCEYQVTAFCGTPEEYDVSESGKWNCANGGMCQSGVSIGDTCDCPNDFEGLHCEFMRGTAPRCDLTCFNGGICKIGVKNYDTVSPQLREYFEQDGGDDTHCVCPKGFTGRQCESSISDCGRSHCLNGGECGKTLKSSGNEYFYCNCGNASSSSTPEGTEIKFAGNACESSSSTFCPAPPGFDKLDFYCTNGGVCAENSGGWCTCPADYSGPRCEFLVQYHTDCNMQCENGGTCLFGDEPTTTPNDDLDIAIESLKEPSVNMHCRCPDGFIGNYCETKIEICGQSQHYCLNNGLCVDNGDEYSCDCPLDGHTPHAGEHCQYAATVICEGAQKSFCTNNGKCKDITDDNNEHHPGCVCDGGFKGEYCEINGLAELIKDVKNELMWFYVSLFIFTSIIICFLLAYYIPLRASRMVSVPQEEEEEDEGSDWQDEEVMHTVVIT